MTAARDARPRLAWFSPLPPSRSGVAAYSAELVPALGDHFVIDSYPEHRAHDFVWRARLAPYDLIVYQLGNAPCHDYMWAYLVRYPGFVVLHDARLHHARARQLLDAGRFDDYRQEFRYDHPDADDGVPEYAIEGLGGPIYYFWSMLGVAVRTAKAVGVHSALVAADLREAFPDATIDTIRMGVPVLPAASDARACIRRERALPSDAIVFAAFGKVTAEKRIAPILKALGTLTREGANAYLMLVGDAESYPSLADEIARSGVADRVRVTGHVADEAIGDHLEAADACLCLRWPTAQETSASWLRCLAAAKPTVISDLAHLVDIPDAAVLRVDLLDEEASLAAAMRRIAADGALRESLARGGRDHWRAHHTLEAMADDYGRAIARALPLPAPALAGLPRHFVADHSEAARAIAEQFGVRVDLFDAGRPPRV